MIFSAFIFLLALYAVSAILYAYVPGVKTLGYVCDSVTQEPLMSVNGLEMLKSFMWLELLSTTRVVEGGILSVNRGVVASESARWTTGLKND